MLRQSLLLPLPIALLLSGCIERYMARYARSHGCEDDAFEIVTKESGIRRVEGCANVTSLACTSAWSNYGCELKSIYTDQCEELKRVGEALTPYKFFEPPADPAPENRPHKEQVRKAIVAQASERFERCMDCALNTRSLDTPIPDLNGRVETSFLISEAGVVSAGSARSNTLPFAFQACILGSLALTRFPKTPMTGVSYPVVVRVPGAGTSDVPIGRGMWRPNYEDD